MDAGGLEVELTRELVSFAGELALKDLVRTEEGAAGERLALPHHVQLRMSLGCAD